MAENCYGKEATAATPEVKSTVQLFTSLNSSCTPVHGQREPGGWTGKLPFFYEQATF